MTTQHAPGFTAARLYKKTSKNGGTYFTGRLGGVKVALLKSKDLADDGGEIWNLVAGGGNDGRPVVLQIVTGVPRRPGIMTGEAYAASDDTPTINQHADI